jgi:predicted nucleotidyltransferase
MLLDTILGSKVAIKALRCLLRRPYREWFFKELVKDLGVGVGSLGRTLKELIARGVVQERTIGRQHFYKANLENSLARSLFDLFTAERRLEIPANLRTALEEMIGRLTSDSMDSLRSAILFGSAAVGTAGPESDLDLLLVFDESPRQIKELRTQLDSVSKFYGVLAQEHVLTKNEFLGMYSLGDDLIINALAEGVVLHDTGFLIPLLSKPLPSPSSAVAMRDLEEARSKIEDAKRNFRAGSLDTTLELVGLAMSLASRGYIILKGGLPGSRHNLASQMREYSPAIATLLNDVSRARNKAAHAKSSVGREGIWRMLRQCEDFVRRGFEESRRVQ